MYKQFQELQRQQQLQQLDQEARQQNAVTQLSAITRHSTGDQLPGFTNGATNIHNSSNYTWPTEIIGGDPKLSNASQMFGASMNWVHRGGPSPTVQGFPNGLMFPQDQSQALRSMGFVPQQQVDQSLYGAPVASARSGSLNHFPHIQGISQDGSDLLNKTGGSQVEKQMMHSAAFNSFESDQSNVFADQVPLQDGSLASKQGFQGKNLFGQVPVDTFGNGVISGNFHQVNSLARNPSTQEFHGRQDHIGWAGTMEEKSATQVVPSLGAVSLDPTEEKILFSSDGIWGAFGRNNGGITSGVLHRSQLEGNDYLNVFPSVQSGSWSALMQSAVAEASSSDTGIQDEWSGLSFQKTDLSPGNHPSTVGNNLQNSSSLTSKPFLSFEDSTTSPDGFQLSSTKFAFEPSERVRTETSHESLQRSPQQGRWLDPSASQKPPEGSLPGQTTMHLGSVTEGAWSGQIFEQSSNAAPSSDMELTLQNMRGPWAQQRSMTSYSTGGSKPNGWNINETLSLSRDSQSNDHHKRPTHTERAHDVDMWRANDSNVGGMPFSNATGRFEQKLVASSPHGRGEDSFLNNLNAVTGSGVSKVSQGMNQQFLNNQELDFEKGIVDSSLNYRGNENLGKYQPQTKAPQVQELSSGNSDRVSGEFEKKQDNCLQKEISSDSYISGRPGRNTVTGVGLKENAWLNASDSRPSATGNQKSSGQVGRKAPVYRKFQYHPMGNVAIESDESTRQFSNSQGLLQQGSQGTIGQEQGFLGQSKFSGQVVLNSGADMEKRNSKAVEPVSRDVHSGFESRTSTSFDSSAGLYAPNRTVQTSQNMLELLHKVDQSRENNAAHFGLSDVNASDRPESDGSDASASHILGNQSAISQGFGLRLGPPSQRQPTASSQRVNELNSSQIDLDSGDKTRTPSGTTQALSNIMEMTQQEHWEHSNHIRPNIPAQTGNEAARSTMQGGSSSSPIAFPCHQPQQQVSSGAKQVGMDQSSNLPFGNQSDLNSQSKLVSRFGGTRNSHDGASAGQSAQESLWGPTGGVSPLNLASKPYLTDVARSQHLNANTAFIRSSGQQESTVTQQGGGFSKMLHNVWTSVPSQQCLGPQQKAPPNLFQSMRPLANSLEGTPWATAKEDDWSVKKGGNASSQFGACSVNSQLSPCGEEQHAGKVSTSQSERADLTPQTAGGQQQSELTGSLSSVVHSHQQEPSQTVPPPVTSTSNIDMEAFGRSLRPSSLPHQNYSLLHQMQVMRDTEADPNRKGGKRLKVTDSGLDTQQSIGKTGQRFMYGYGTSGRDAMDNDSSSDSKMLCFASEVKEDKSANTSSQLPVGGISMQDYTGHLGIAAFRGTGIQAPVNPQMAPSWFEQYGTYKNGQILGLYDGLDSSRRNAKMAAQQFFFGEALESLPPTSYSVVADHGNAGSTAVSASEHLPSSLAPPVVDHSLAIVRPKKRKSSISELLTWHKEVTNRFQRLQTISEAELDWAQATNRRAEKLEDEAEMFEDGLYIPRPRRRLILTTQLVQQLLRALPAGMLSADATSEYETVTFFVARLALGDACSLVSSSGSDSCLNSNHESTTSEKQKESGSLGERFFANVAEDFIGRARKLESDLLRLDRRSSILDLRVECQDLERFSIINRFARYLGRGNADGVESSSSMEAAVRRPLPQRYVTAIAMPTPRNLPEGVLCLSL